MTITLERSGVVRDLQVSSGTMAEPNVYDRAMVAELLGIDPQTVTRYRATVFSPVPNVVA